VKLRIILKMAFENLASHRMRTLLTISGVTIGIAAIIFLVSLGYGLEKLVTNQVSDLNAFTIIDVPVANAKTIKINQAAIDKIAGFGHVKTVAPVTNIAGRIRQENSSSTTETVIMAGRADYWSMADITTAKGELSKNSTEIVLDQSVIDLIGEKADHIIGQKINLDLIIPTELSSSSSGASEVIENVALTVSGITQNNQTPLVYVSLDLLALHHADSFSALKVRVDKKDNVDTIRKEIENTGLATEYVGDTVNEISRVFALFRVILAAFGLIALIVASLGTFNILTISLLERTREIGLFKALGMRNRDIYKVFLSEALIIGLAGGITGMIFGGSLSQGINFLLSIISRRSGADELKVFLTPWTFSVSVALFSILIGFITGWYPARRAVRIKTLDALRNE
jgi:putative ABC transport system permease protein